MPDAPGEFECTVCHMSSHVYTTSDTTFTSSELFFIAFFY